MDLKNLIRTIPDFPKKGIMFRDITTLLKDAQGFTEVINQFYDRYKNVEIDKIAGIESRGFILAGALAYKMGKSFVPVRKPGKLPAEKIRVEYDLEYGKDILEMHKDSISPGDKVLLIDDLLATSGTVSAAIKLVEMLGGNVLECAFIVALPELGGAEKLGKPSFSLVSFEGH